MCQFCVEHGEGKRWYLNAKNYAYDLESDIKRSEYIVHFVTDFAETRENAIAWMERLNKLPAPVERAGKAAASRHMQSRHFGQPVPLEDCEEILNLATSITAIPCICRMHTPGKKADEVCVLVTTQPVEPYLRKGFESYADGPDLDDFHTMDVEQTMALLRSCEENGLMHSIWTFQTPFAAAICNCNLESGCMAMKLTEGYQMKMMWRGESVISLDSQACVGCGECVSLCPFSAIEANGSITAHAEKCWGCGICRAACIHDALTLVERTSVPAVATLW